MKLLLDQNLSPRLIARLTSVYPGISHVSLVGLDRAPDSAVWDYARANGFAIVTKDSDFNDMSVLRGVPPKVIWLRLGNCTTDMFEQVLRRAHTQVTAFENDDAVNVRELL
jgi:predicted nuclease of predicted toxin-antitoxin system